MFGGQHHEGRAEYGIRPGCEYLQLVMAILRGKEDSSPLGPADPVALHLLHGVRPFKLLQSSQQPFSVGRDPEEPLAHPPALHGVAAPFRQAVPDLVIGQDSS